MRNFIGLCNKFQYLGLLGLLSFIFDNKLLNFFWLFWLLGFVGIFYNFPVFLQSLKQLVGMITAPLRYGFNMPNADNYQNKIQYSLPFHGTWTAVNGGIDKKNSHSWSIQTQRYAYDFVILDEEGHSFSGVDTKLSDYYCYGKKILAPADGVVVEVQDTYPDSLLLGKGQADCSAKDIRGNYILIRHAHKEYGLLAHLKPGSICVKKGDIVKRGQYIAYCGNSGNTSEPHLHFHLQDGINFYTSAGLPIEFTGITKVPANNYHVYDPRTFLTSSNSKFIFRSLKVSNI